MKVVDRDAKIKLVKFLRDQGCEYKDIADTVGVSLATVWRWLLTREEQQVLRQKKQSARRTLKGRLSNCLAQGRRRARKGGYSACTASVDDVTEKWTGKCFVCGVPEAECTTSLHIDHDHESGEFRGWLCGSCNRGLGFMKDDPRILRLAAVYLEKDI